MATAKKIMTVYGIWGVWLYLESKNLKRKDGLAVERMCG